MTESAQNQVDVGDVGSTIVECIEFDAGLDENAGGSGLWDCAPCGATPIEDHGTTEQAVWYVTKTRDGSFWKITIEPASDPYDAPDTANLHAS